MSENQTKTAPKPEVYGAKKKYERWTVEISHDEKKGRTYKKVKKEPGEVKISEETAETLNNGVLNMPLDSNNRYPIMYFLPGKG